MEEIRIPVHTSADGDTIFALSPGGVEADHDLVGMLAAQEISRAITRAVLAAESAFGFPAARDIRFARRDFKFTTSIPFFAF